MGMQQIQLEPKVKKGKGGLFGSIIGGVLGAVAGAFTAGTASGPLATAGAALGGAASGMGAGGMIGSKVDPSKVEDRSALGSLEGASQQYPEVQAAELAEAGTLVDTVPGMQEGERSLLKNRFEEARKQTLSANDAMKKLYGRDHGIS